LPDVLVIAVLELDPDLVGVVPDDFVLTPDEGHEITPGSHGKIKAQDRR
jgi:hypothetical protein